MPAKLSCACAPVRAAERGVVEYCRPIDRKSHTPDWPTPPQSGHSPSHGSPRPCERSAAQELGPPGACLTSTCLRAIEFADDELAVPGQDGVRSGYIRHLAENFAAQSMSNLAESRSLGVRQPQ